MKKVLVLLSIVIVLCLVIGCPHDTPTPEPVFEDYTSKTASIGMIAITGTGSGTFSMGSAEGEANAGNDEKPEHPVTLNSFYLGSTEVTEAQWEAVMTDWPVTDPAEDTYGYSSGDNHPARYISWYDAIEFCNALTRAELKEDDVVYTITKENETNQDTWTVAVDVTKSGYRLPTEAEWEYAAGGAILTPGKLTTYAGTSEGADLGEYAVFNTSNPSEVKEGRKPVSDAYALYDMSGNVWEWCYDWYDYGYYNASANPDNNDNPTGPASSPYSYRVCRGGYWDGSSSRVRVANRNAYAPSDRYGYFGFRVVRSAVSP